jgi:hypothetical protein
MNLLRYMDKSTDILFVPGSVSGKTKTIKRFANVNDKIKAIRRIVKENYHQVAGLAEKLQAETCAETFENIWYWVRDNIKYQNDKKGKEQLRTPQRTIYDKMGDCDDMSILISSILTNLGYEHDLNVVAYKAKNRWQHIYPSAYDRSGNRYVLDCVPEIPHFNYEEKPIINQITIDMRLEELGTVSQRYSYDNALSEMSAPFVLEGMDNDSEVILLQGLLGNIALVDEDDEYDTVLSGTELTENIILKQLIQAKDSLEKELINPTELSEINDNRKDLQLINEIIENFENPESRHEIIQEAINQNTLYRNFYHALKYGLEDGLSGDLDDDTFYLKVIAAEQGLLDEEDFIDGVGRLRLPKRRSSGAIKRITSKARQKLSKLKKNHPKLAKVTKALKKFSPATFTARRTLEPFLLADTFQLSSKIAIGYLSEVDARKMGYSKAEWLRFVEGRKKAEMKWVSLGGSKDHFKKIIIKGRGGRKSGLRGELGVAPAVISAAMQVFGVVVEFFKQLKLKKQNQQIEKQMETKLLQSKENGIITDGEGSGEDSNVETDEKSGVSKETFTDENGNEKVVYKDKDGNEISKSKAFILKNKTILIVVGIVLVVGIIGLIIWKMRQTSMKGLGGEGISVRQENFIKRQQLNNRSYAALVREEIRKDGKRNNKTNRRQYYKKVFQESFARPLSQKQISAAQGFNELRRRVREKAKAYGGGKEGWRKAWADVKKKN